MAWSEPGAKENSNLISTEKEGLDATIFDSRCPASVLHFLSFNCTQPCGCLLFGLLYFVLWLPNVLCSTFKQNSKQEVHHTTNNGVTSMNYELIGHVIKQWTMAQ